MIFLLCTFVSGSTSGASPLQLSLEKALEMAMEYNTEIQKSKIDTRIAQQQIRETTAIGLPQISASLGYQYYIDVPTSLVPAEFFGGEPGDFAEIQFGTEQNLFASATVNQIIFSGEYIVGLRAARIYRDIASHGLKRTGLEVKNMITETYLLVLLTISNLSILNENLENLQQTLFETEKIMEAGFTDPINVDQLRLTVSNMKSNMSNLERQVQVTENLLKFQIGIDLYMPILLTESLEDLLDDLAQQAYWSHGFEPSTHIDYKLASSQEAFSTMVLRREQSFYLPSLSASFTRQEMAMRNEFNFLEGGYPWFPSTYFCVNLTIPIFSSGMRSSRVQQARLELEKAKLSVLQVEQSLIMQLEKANTDFDNAMEKYNDQKENLNLAERILQRTRIMHKEGLASSLELTQANEQFLATQSNYISAMFDLLNARNDLEKALGR
jgi:outer membrane protein